MARKPKKTTDKLVAVYYSDCDELLNGQDNLIVSPNTQEGNRILIYANVLEQGNNDHTNIAEELVTNDEKIETVEHLKELDNQHGELKSMRTSSLHLRKGVAKRLLEHIIEEAKLRGYRRLSLETGMVNAKENVEYACRIILLG